MGAEAVMMMLGEHPELSNCRIAQLCGVTDTTVRNIRRELGIAPAFHVPQNHVIRDPTPDEIEDECVVIRSYWDEREHYIRAGRRIPPRCATRRDFADDNVVAAWTLPGMSRAVVCAEGGFD